MPKPSKMALFRMQKPLELDTVCFFFEGSWYGHGPGSHGHGPGHHGPSSWPHSMGTAI